MLSPSARASMKAIAEESGVSIMTVSRVFNGSGKVAAATEEKIRLVAERLQYRPNRLVRGMQSGRTGLIGVVMPSGLGFYSGVLEGIHNHLTGQNANLVLSLVHGDWGASAIEEEREILHRLIELRVEGIILRPVNDEATPVYFEEIIQTRNNYDKDVFNGDIGRVSGIDHAESRLTVAFDGGEKAEYAFDELDELTPAYAITVHKSQGSEFPAVVIPLSTQYYLMLQRNLLYTGITRGRRLVVLIGQK
jgi:transcriptional regulator with XRE-family HTH domain